MSFFGKELRRERETRNITLPQISESTKIALYYLQALEDGNLRELPGGVFGKGYVRAYAEFVGLDPERLIEEYLRARKSMGLEVLEDEDAPIETRVGERTGGRSLRVRPWVPFFLLLGLILLAIGGWAYFRDRQPESATGQVGVPRAAEVPAENGGRALPLQGPSSVGEPRPLPLPGQQTPPIEVEENQVQEEQGAAEEFGDVSSPQPQERPAAGVSQGDSPLGGERSTPAESGEGARTSLEGGERLSIPEFGVGTGVVQRQLVNRGQRFAEGSQIWFWTRVLGGEAGERIQHVWLRREQEVDSIELVLGGPRWRLHSIKTLHPGSAGQWAVEARDSQGRVLAREEFTCFEKGSVGETSPDDR